MMDALVAIATSDFWVSIRGGFYLKLPTLLLFDRHSRFGLWGNLYRCALIHCEPCKVNFRKRVVSLGYSAAASKLSKRIQRS